MIEAEFENENEDLQSVTPDNLKDILNAAIKVYGKEHQIDRCIEEMSELTKALLKYKRGGGTTENINAVIDEIADVQITIMQMALLFNKSAVEDRKGYKIERLIRYMENERFKRLIECLRGDCRYCENGRKYREGSRLMICEHMRDIGITAATAQKGCTHWEFDYSKLDKKE